MVRGETCCDIKRLRCGVERVVCGNVMWNVQWWCGVECDVKVGVMQNRLA